MTREAEQKETEWEKMVEDSYCQESHGFEGADYYARWIMKRLQVCARLGDPFRRVDVEYVIDILKKLGVPHD